MGKICTSFDANLYPYGPDFKVLSQIVNSLSGNTTLLSCILECYGTIWKVEFHNNLLLDGTEIVGKYKNHSSGTSSFPVFCGVDIINPPVKPVVTPTGHKTFTTGTGIVALPTGGGGYLIGGANSTPITIKIDHLDKNGNIIKLSCTCGAEKCGSSVHSSYCDKEDKS
jgi:hypothetical protein